MPPLTRDIYRTAVRQLFEEIRAANKWDYVLVDTRGGFGFETTDVCALSDSFFLVTEPDHTSFHQDKNLVFRIVDASTDLGRKPTLRGIIVNKATEFTSTENNSTAGVHELNLDNIEARFRNVLVDELSLRYSDTYAVPL